MCTLTLVPFHQHLRIVFNRDELLTRPAARPPALTRLRDRTMAYPVDMKSGGTWIGVNDSGLTLALLNVSEGSRTGPPRYSRGHIIPPLLEHGSFASAVNAAGRLRAEAFQPFRLIAADETSCGVVSSNGVELSVDVNPLDRPRLFTSSSLGDALVEGPRRQLFEQLILQQTPDSWFEAQARFHAHRWPDRAELSVWMSRRDAATVSRSMVDVTADAIRFEYEPLGAVTQRDTAMS